MMPPEAGAEPKAPEADADPEIPEGLRSKLARKHRPADFTPKGGEEADEDNPPPETPAIAPRRSLKKFWAALKVVLAEPANFSRTEWHERIQRKKGQPARKIREPLVVEVEFTVGADGLPYPVVPPDAEETRRVRGLVYADAPKQDPQWGDLTLDFVEWLYLKHPYDAAVRYAGRNTHVQAEALERAAKL